MKKLTFLVSATITMVMLLSTSSLKAQFGCGSGVVITNGFTQNGITTPGTGGAEDWNVNPTGTSVNASYWDDDVYLFEYTAGATTEQISMTIFTRNSWNGIGIFDDCIGNTFSNELDADAATGGNLSHTVTATIAAGNTVYIAVGQWGTPDDLDFDVTSFTVTPILCADPTALTAASITATSADLGWTDNAGAPQWDIEYGATPFTPTGTPTITGTGTNPHNLTGLTPNTNYEFYVRADCGGANGTSNWVGPFAFTTACNAFTIPFTENFSSTSTTQNCWTVINNNADADAWDMDYTSNPFVGDQVAAMYTDGNGGNNDDYLVSPTITLTGNERLRFFYRVQSAGEPNDFQVTLSTTGIAPANFTNTLLALDTVSNTTYQEQIVNLSAYTGNVNIAFHVPNGGIDGWRLYIDSVVVEVMPACADPNALTVSNVTTTSVDLGWTDNAGASMWDIEYGTTPFTPTGTPTITGTTTNPHNLTGLTPSTNYEYYVRADCGGSGTSNWVGPFAFYTGHCTVVSTNTGSYMDNFSTTGGTTNISNLASGYATNGYEDATAMAVSQFAGGSVNFTTDFVGTTVGYNIWVDWNNDLDFDDVGEDVYASGAYVSNASGTIAVPGGTPLGNYRMRMRCDYNATNPNACGTSGSGRNETEDYTFTVIAMPSCLQPSNQTVASITATSADLGWTDNAGAAAWDIEYGAVPFTPTGTPTITGTTTNPHNVNSLTANTTYEFYVRADCGGSGTSTWEGPFAFTTACNAFTVPFVENFTSTSTTQNCWTVINNNNDADAWDMDYTSNPLTGDEVAMMYTDGNSGADDDFLVSPTITLTGNERLRFSYRVESAAEPNDFQVTLSTTGIAPANFTNTLQPLTTVSNITYQEQTISLAAYTGNVNIAFHIPPGTTDGWRLYIDSVVIEANPPNDIGVVDITSSATSGCGLGMETVTARIANFGSAAQTGFDVVYELNSTPITPENVSATVNPGDTLTYVFTTLANMATPGNYTIDAYTNLTGDSDNSNDTLNGWSATHYPNSLSYNDSMAVSSTITEGTNSIVCTNGLVSSMLDTCYRLTAVVIDSLVHDYEADLDLWLISPANDTLELSTDNGATAAGGYINVTFTDTAANNVTTATQLSNGGFFMPEEAAGLAKFNGTNPEGAWTLRVVDHAGGDDGTLYAWHLEFTDYSFNVSLGNDTNLCLNENITLDAGITGNHAYSWSTGDVTQQVTLDTNTLGGSGTYNIMVTVTDTVSGCQVMDTISVDFSVCAGINASANNVTVDVYPNPNNGVFSLNVNTQDVNSLDIKVMNLQGQEVFSKNSFTNLNKVNEQIDLSNHADGIYFVMVTTDKGTVTHKIIIQ